MIINKDNIIFEGERERLKYSDVDLKEFCEKLKKFAKNNKVAIFMPDSELEEVFMENDNKHKEQNIGESRELINQVYHNIVINKSFKERMI